MNEYSEILQFRFSSKYMKRAKIKRRYDEYKMHQSKAHETRQSVCWNCRLEHMWRS